jgi:hypothetical protein
LKWRHYLRWNLLTHVVLQSFFQKSVEDHKVNLGKETLPANTLPPATFRRMLKQLRAWISALKPRGAAKTVWQEYSKTHSYSSEEVERKKRFVGDFARRARPKLIWDLGCNTGIIALPRWRPGRNTPSALTTTRALWNSPSRAPKSKTCPFSRCSLMPPIPLPIRAGGSKKGTVFRRVPRPTPFSRWHSSTTSRYLTTFPLTNCSAGSSLLRLTG